jgi:hypothetical protein
MTITGMSRARYTTVMMIVTGHGAKARGFLAFGKAMEGVHQVALRRRLKLEQECGERSSDVAADLRH